MKCDRCGEADATVHVTDVVHKARRDRHLCDACAEAEKLFGPADESGPADTAAGLNLQALVSLVFGPAAPIPAAPPVPPCPVCGLLYAAFRASGRLGCPADYDNFRPALLPLLDRLHRGASHAGKRPRSAEVHQLRDRLAAAVAAEDYETAAGLRDLLRQKERAG